MIPHEKVYTGEDFLLENVSAHNSWYLYACYGDDFIGCPTEDYEDSVECSKSNDRTTDDKTGCEPSPKR